VKNLILVLALTVLGACGPQQTSTERDQQQLAAERKREQGFYKPFAGTYVGNATIQNRPRQISLYLVPSDEADSDVSRLSQTPIASLKGQFLMCLTDPTPCFNTDPYNPNNTEAIVITKAIYNTQNSLNIQLFSVGSATSISGQVCDSSTTCPFSYDVYLSGDLQTMTGEIYQGTNPVGPITLTRVK
jgi:hypothetical protein